MLVAERVVTDLQVVIEMGVAIKTIEMKPHICHHCFHVTPVMRCPGSMRRTEFPAGCQGLEWVQYGFTGWDCQEKRTTIGNTA
jgi:hypothetical protein